MAIDPFVTGQRDGHDIGAVDAASRQAMVKNFTLEQCEDALKISGLQLSVRRALEVRVRRLKAAE